MNSLIAAVLTLVLGQGTPQQQPPSGASVEGIVVDFESGQPIEQATVELRRAQDIAPQPIFQIVSGSVIATFAAPITTATGPDGKFIFKDPPVGEYRLYATRPMGHIPAEYAQRTPTGGGTAFTITAGRKMSGITLRMARVGSISGRIVDAAGDPVIYASVELIRTGYSDGMRRLIRVQDARTDDRGEYRFYSLAPGQYYVASRPWDVRSTRGNPSSEPTIVPNRSANREAASSPLLTRRVIESGDIVEETWMPVYYPGTPDPRSARAIALRMGENVSGIEFSLALSAAPARHVRGTVIDGATGMPAAGALIRLTPRELLTPNVVMPMATADARGMFDVPGVLPEAYSLIVSGTVSGYAVIDAGGSDVNNMQLVGVKGVDIPVRVNLDEGAGLLPPPPPPPIPVPANSPLSISSAVMLAASNTSLRVTLVREPGTGAPTGNFVITAGWAGIPPNTVTTQLQSVSPGNFIMRQVPLGEYRISIAGLAPGSYVKAIRRGQTDVLRDGLRVTTAGSPTDDALEISIGANAGVLAGRVFNEARDAASNVTVVLVPSLRRSRIDLYQSVSTDANGVFRFQGIVPDEYKLFAWEEVATGAWHDAEFIGQYEIRGTVVNVSPGTNSPQELKVIPWSAP